jgi:hypothetical protein
MKVKVWKLLGLILIAIFALSAAKASATPTMSSMAGTYVPQSGTGYTIVLYQNGTGLFSTYSGTWSIINSTTFEGTYTILFSPRTDYFTITNNGFTAAQTGNVYVKNTSASSSPTASVSPSPTVPEFSSAAVILVAVAIVVITLSTVTLKAKKSRK